VLALGCLVFAAVYWRGRAPAPEQAPVRRETWTMPPLALLGKPEWSRGRIVAMYIMRGSSSSQSSC